MESSSTKGNIRHGKLKSQKELKTITDSEEYKKSDYEGKTKKLNVATAKRGKMFDGYLSTFDASSKASTPKNMRGVTTIVGVKPGSETADFLDNILSRITLPGSLMLAAIAIIPAFAMLFGVGDGFAMFMGGTSMLIMVGVTCE